MILTLCRCGRICAPGKKRCAEHQPKDNRPNSWARGYDSQHIKDRARLLRQRPVCEDPYNEGCTAKSTVLDHVDGCGPLGPFGHAPENWMALCASCHGRKTAEQTPGGWAA